MYKARFTALSDLDSVMADITAMREQENLPTDELTIEPELIFFSKSLDLTQSEWTTLLMAVRGLLVGNGNIELSEWVHYNCAECLSTSEPVMIDDSFNFSHGSVDGVAGGKYLGCPDCEEEVEDLGEVCRPNLTDFLQEKVKALNAVKISRDCKWSME